MNLGGEMVLPVADRLVTLGVPFIFITGYDEDCNRGLHMAVPTLAKPFGNDELVDLVEDLTARK